MPKYRKSDAESKMAKGIAHEVAGDKTTYPSILHMDEGDLEEVKDWKVGETYEVKLKIKCIKMASDGSLAPPDDSDAEKVHAQFEVIEAECDEGEGDE